MSRRCLILILWLAFTLASSASAKASDVPTIAILRFGGSYNLSVTESTLLDMLEAEGFISADERTTLDGRADLQGEKLNIVWNDGGFDLPTVNLMVDAALDAEADVLVTLTTPVTRAALNATIEMAQPPVILFASVYHPYAAGIAQTPCLKPAHVTGSQIMPRYDDLLLVLSMQAPEIGTIGVLFNSSEASGAIGARAIAELAEAQGLTVLQTAVTSIADLPTAIEGLVSRGMEALLLPIDSITAVGLHSIVHMSYEYSFPIFYPAVGSIYDGATFGVGFHSHYQQGINLGIMLTAWLNGEMDPAATAIDVMSGRTLGVNLDAAAQQGVNVIGHLRKTADVLVEDGTQAMTSAARARVIPPSIEQLRAEQAAQDDYLESLQCTVEMIAEQQAALDAGE